MNRRRFFVVIGCVVAAVLLALFLWGLRIYQGARTVQLPNGCVVSLTRVTFGKNHRYYTGGWLQQAIAPLLTTNLARRIGVKTYKLDRNHNTLVCWFEVTSPTPQPFALFVVDAEGRESRQDLPVWATVAPGSHLHGYEILSFPRRDKDLRLRLCDLSKADRVQLAEFKIRNPAPRVYPKWTPEPLPITKKVGKDEFTLTSFNTGLYATGGLARMCLNWSELNFEFGPKDSPTGPWEPLWIEVSDATGNFVRERNPKQRMGANLTVMAQMPRGPIRDRGAISLMSTLWLDEPAWRVRVEYVRLPALSNFRPEETWTVKTIAVPEWTNGFTEVNLRTNLDRESIVFKGIRAKSLVKGGDSMSLNATVEARLESPAEGLLALAKVTDNRGTNIWIDGPRPAGVSGRNFGLRNVSAEAKTLDLTFVVHRSCIVEFVARPTLLETNIAKTTF